MIWKQGYGRIKCWNAQQDIEEGVDKGMLNTLCLACSSASIRCCMCIHHAYKDSLFKNPPLNSVTSNGVALYVLSQYTIASQMN
jgi:hypothetical protein